MLFSESESDQDVSIDIEADFKLIESSKKIGHDVGHSSGKITHSPYAMLETLPVFEELPGTSDKTV